MNTLGQSTNPQTSDELQLRAPVWRWLAITFAALTFNPVVLAGNALSADYLYGDEFSHSDLMKFLLWNTPHFMALSVILLRSLFGIRTWQKTVLRSLVWPYIVFFGLIVAFCASWGAVFLLEPPGSPSKSNAGLSLMVIGFAVIATLKITIPTIAAYGFCSALIIKNVLYRSRSSE